MEYRQSLQIPETAREIIRAVERGELDLAELEGFRARLYNHVPSANIYELVNAELAAAWQIGWDQADQEVLLENLANVVSDLLEHSHVDAEGQPHPDPHLWELLRVSFLAVLKYRQ